MARIVLCGLILQTVVIFEFLPLAVAIFGCSLPLAVAIFLLIWHFYLRRIAIFVQVVEIVRPFHR